MREETQVRSAPPEGFLRIRSFIAVPLPESVRTALATFGAQSSLEAKWVEAENLHLTIKFLGNLGDAELLRIGPALADAVSTAAPFEISLGQLGAFPDRREPRVLWVGLRKGLRGAVDLHERLESTLFGLGIAQPDAKSYTPHVTLARARAQQQLVTSDDFFETHVPPAAEASFTARHVTLYMSELTRTGPIHTVMSEVPLRG